jgi:hypothetical protein
MKALAARHDAPVRMIDTSMVRVHQHGPALPMVRIKRWDDRGAASQPSFTPSSMGPGCP